MNAHAAGSGAIAANFPLLHDPRVGIIAELAETPRETGAPDFIHYRARTCFTGALGGVQGRFTATAAAPIREEAAARAVERALARYAAALYDRDALPLASVAESGFATIPPEDFTIYSRSQLEQPGFPYVSFDSDTPVGGQASSTLPEARASMPPPPLCGTPMRISAAAAICPSRRRPRRVSPVARVSRRQRSPG